MKGFRYENKFLISRAAYLQLKARLDAGIRKDAHTSHPDGAYFIRSLYFDDDQQTGLLDKIEGVQMREKFRIRFYDLDDSFIRLECKQKLDQMTRKFSAPLTREQVDSILRGDVWWMCNSEHALIRDFYAKYRTRVLRPMVIVDYFREAYVFQDVRITFDRDIHSGLYATELFDGDILTAPVMPSDRMVIEVKYDDALPSAVRQLLKTVPMSRVAISKYELCRKMQ